MTDQAASTASTPQFSLTADQLAFRETAARFAAEVLAPTYKAREKAATVPIALRRQMGEIGLIGVEFPESCGGLGVDHVTAGVVLEAIAEGDFNVGYVQLLSSLCGAILSRHAAPEIAADLLPKVVGGEVLLCIALTEPQGGSDAASLRLKAVRDGDDWVLTGEKTSISMADQADWAVVFARTGTVESRAHGISAFLVDMRSPGISTTRFDDLGQLAIGRGSIFFDGVRVPATHMLGKEGSGFVQVMQGFDFSRALIGLQCLSVARVSLAETWAYVQERKAFGKPLSDNQGVTFPLAEAETLVEAARLLCFKTLAAKDAGLPHTKEAAMCKWWPPKLAYEVVNTCLLLHGHAGYDVGLPFEQRMRDVLGLQIGDGTAQIMKLIIAREALRAAAA
ncbi:cyclohexanecarboxyl-CoA dehydrogenase [Pinisolibacter aquiterrae]|uniref:cyclohexanecarboxyl-CoA dehydrogenase n=1 Tax=Pinisolibacter aquiterrae TaxID=2815579 RepID=UPI001C3DA133|nr:cyclohexanecarboxyl-CoA dehydrogenase [Pinisolibacter aquiterrae]MBV5265449.1 cyclohexanecarboxyl-CoA dehydrogenase [Pinisolibacter aquiterrae]MCC8236082.1 cyclohexanecarboxyl-CoA dehydrogenase [Pinisolibacter aquiterrae]